MSQTDRYDANAPETDSPTNSQYFNKKDARVMAAGVFGFFLIGIPVFFIAKDARDKTVCVTNIKEIYTALGAYADIHDERFPPLYETGAGNIPFEENGPPVTWVTLVSPFLSKRGSFVCPAAKEDEKAFSVNGADPSKPIASTYGFYAAYGGVARNQVDNPEQTLLLAETSNAGSQGTFDPLRFTKPDGTPNKNDGFVIGWDNSNVGPDEKTKSVTRVAWRNTSNGKFGDTGPGRHNAGLNFVFASGEKLEARNSHPGVCNAQWLPGKYVLDSPWGNPILKSQK